MAFRGLCERNDRVKIDDLGLVDFLLGADHQEDAGTADLMLVPVCEEIVDLLKLTQDLSDSLLAYIPVIDAK